ncbi:MAG: hypothetical protein O7E52_22440 [Candidatus Poribacteria bacterium]|nr:hypothetical protein [Candidatus Poribacteria bacterium]
MRLLRSLVILALILGLVLLALKIVVPVFAWAFQLAMTLLLLGAIGFAVIYLYRKLRA